MNKNIKRIIAMVLVFGTVSAVTPATNVNLLTTRAYAADDDENTDETLDSLQLETSTGNNIKIYSSSSYDSDDRLDDDDTPDETTYYAKTSSSTVVIDTGGPSTKYVKVFTGTSKSTKGKAITSDISLSSGTNTLIVRVYNNKPDSGVKYEDDDDVSSEYKIKVKYTGSDSDSDSDSSTSTDSADDYDDIYLSKLSVEGESISLSDSKILYTYNVASNIDEVTVKATPDYDYYTVTIDGNEVDESDKWKDTVSLKTGINEIKIKIEDEDENDEKVYTLKITRGNTASTGTSTTTEVTTNVKMNQWVQVNGVWQYNDSTGTPIKNSWFTDRTLGKEFYLQSDGRMATEWLNINGYWYYLGSDGGKKTGWQQVSGTWYYLDSQGIMQTGWMKDITGKYYYLNYNGAMASNTTIGQYKLGYDGAWIK